MPKTKVFQQNATTVSGGGEEMKAPLTMALFCGHEKSTGGFAPKSTRESFSISTSNVTAQLFIETDKISQTEQMQWKSKPETLFSDGNECTDFQPSVYCK